MIRMNKYVKAWVVFMLWAYFTFCVVIPHIPRTQVGIVLFLGWFSSTAPMAGVFVMKVVLLDE